MEDYFASKQKLFSGLGGPPPRFAALNWDDTYARRIALAAGTHVYRYGLGPDAAVRGAYFGREMNLASRALRNQHFPVAKGLNPLACRALRGRV